jgi:hypothetical protein
MLRRVLPLALLLAVPALATAQDAALPDGWTARPDRAGRSIMFSAMGPGHHLKPGGSGIVYRAADRSGNKFHAVVTFVQTKAPEHPEAYGVFLAGNDLDADTQSYVYFLVRGDGKYTVKRRTGATAPTVVDWTDSDAIVKADAEGKAKNTVEIDATGEKVVFKVNGKAVHEMAEANRAGVIGLRLNHGLDVHIEGFAVHKM